MDKREQLTREYTNAIDKIKKDTEQELEQNPNYSFKNAEQALKNLINGMESRLQKND